MGQIVSSEYNDEGWTPRPDYLAKRKYISTKYGWFPMADGFGARESFFDQIMISICFLRCYPCYVLTIRIFFSFIRCLTHFINYL
jgi:hypothetical protein